MIGICAPLADRAADLDAVAVGEHEVDDRRVRRPHRDRRRAPPSRSSPGRPRSRRRRGSPAARGGSAARRRRPARARRPSRSVIGRRRRSPASGSRSTKLAPCPGSDSARSGPPLASTKPRAIARPRPGRRRPRRSGRARRPARAPRGRSRARGRRPGHAMSAPIRRALASLTGSLAGEAGRVLEHVGERALELGGVGLEQRQLRLDANVEAAGGRRHRRRGRLDQLLGRVQSARGSSCPPAAREVEQVVDQPGEPLGSRRRSPPASSARSHRRASGRAQPAGGGRIAVSGERRSWETERSSAVLTTLLRRSARVSITCASSPSRSARRGEQRLEARDHALAERRRPRPPARRAGTRPSPCGRPSTTIGSARRRWSPRSTPPRPRPRAGSNARAIRWPTTRSESSSSAPPEQHARHLGAQVRLARRRSASSARLRAAPRACWRPRPRRRGRPRAHPVLALGDREPARRRDVEEVERQRAQRRPCRRRANPQ